MLILGGGVASTLLVSRFFVIDSHLVWQIGYPALFLIGAVGALLLFLPVPMLPLVFAGGSMLDPYTVALTAAAGMTTGMAITYLAGTLGRRPMFRLLYSRRQWYAKWIRRTRREYRSRTIVSSFVIAAVPNPVYNYSGLIAGSMRISMRRFCFGTFLGKTSQALVVALAGFYTAGNLPGLS
jgi:membrane protein DedA with SNARE-associated domain